MPEKFIQDALILCATIDPIGTLALFAAITAGIVPAQSQSRHRGISVCGTADRKPGNDHGGDFADRQRPVRRGHSGDAAIMLAVLLVTWALMLLADPILRIIGKNGAAILVKVMGMILAALSVELVLNALGIPGWARAAL